MTWRTDPPRRQCKCIVLDTWHNFAVATFRPELGWWDGKCWRKDFALCWIDIEELPAVPAHLLRERW